MNGNMNGVTETINFADMDALENHGRRLYAGRDEGQAHREKYNLDEKDFSDGVIEVIIPNDTYAITCSFFLGLFAKSVHALGGSRQFRAKYTFQASKEFQNDIAFHIVRAVREKYPDLQ